MSTLDCPRCGELCIFPGHTCPPRYRVWEPDEQQEADGLWFYAGSAETAAEKWAERHDARNDYHIVGGSPTTVMVLVEGGLAAPVAFVVEGETVPSYSARLAKPCPLCSLPYPPVDTVMRDAADERVWVHDRCRRKQQGATP